MATTITIEGVPGTFCEMTLSSAQNERDRLSVTLISAEGVDLRPNIDDEALVVEDSVTVFGGSVKTPELSGLGTAPIALSIRFSALDYNELGDRVMLMDLVIPTGSLKAAATALLPFLPGVTIDSTWTDVGDTLPELTYDGCLADGALEDLSVRTGWVRHINYEKKLKFWNPGTVSAPWNITDGDGNVIALSSTKTRKDYANRIVVKFMEEAESAWGYFGPDQGSSALPTNGETVTVGSKTYTWRTTINNGVANEILIGATVNACVVTLACAIIEGAGKSYTYSTPTTASTQVRAWEGAPNRVSIKSLEPGAAGNSVATTETCAAWRCYHEGNIVYGHLEGGSDAAASNVIQCDDVAEQASYDIYTRIVEAPNVWTVADAVELGNAILAEAIVVLETVRYSTQRTGIFPGMTQTIASAVRHIPSASYLITSVETRWMVDQATQRDVIAIKGSVFKSVSWRGQYRKWSGTAGVSGSVGSAMWYGGGTSTPPRLFYTFGGSRSLYTAPNPKAWTPIPEWETFKAAVAFSSIARVWLWARTAGITTSARLVSGTDGITFGTVVAGFTDVTSQTAVERVANFNATLDTYYRIEIQPSSDGEGVGCVGYAESL